MVRVILDVVKALPNVHPPPAPLTVKLPIDLPLVVTVLPVAVAASVITLPLVVLTAKEPPLGNVKLLNIDNVDVAEPNVIA